MKSLKNFKRTITFAFILPAILLSSCKKNTIDPSGSFDIRVVNAAPGTGPQSFAIAGQVIVAGGLKFTEASNYINFSSGKRLVCEFKNENTGSPTASGELYTTDGVSFTAFLAGSGSSARVKFFEDNLAAANGGMAKIKFIHLSDAAPSDLNIKGGGSELVTNISRNTESGYRYVNPGTLTISIYGTALGKNIANFDVVNLQAGKIYTLYLTGDTDATLRLDRIQYN